MQSEAQYELRLLREDGIGPGGAHPRVRDDQDALNYASLAANSRPLELCQEGRLVWIGTAKTGRRCLWQPSVEELTRRDLLDARLGIQVSTVSPDAIRDLVLKSA